MNQTLLPGTWQSPTTNVIAERTDDSDPGRAPGVDPVTTGVVEVSRNDKNNNQINQDQENTNLIKPIW
jgi:hypothetical protein